MKVEAAHDGTADRAAAIRAAVSSTPEKPSTARLSLGAKVIRRSSARPPTTDE
jgi:hypothetical protein